MRIAQLVSPLHPVDARATKAIYSHSGVLVDRIVEAGHEVELFAAAGSRTKGRLHSVLGAEVELSSLSPDMQRHYIDALISDCYANAGSVDVVHSHFSLLTAFFAALSKTPTLISVHSPIRDAIRPLLLRYKELRYVSFSHAQRKQMPELNWAANIYHGVDVDLFSFAPEPEDYFLYLGRVTKEKGVHFAIEAAKAAGVKLRIAGGSYSTEGYWHEHIEKEINGVSVRYMGEADEQQKIKLLQGAKALLFPTQYDETFGLVMIEAMACGTPVIAWRNGAVPEVVSHGHTGYIVESVDDMVAAIGAIDRISRATTRKRAVDFFSQQKMVQGYLRVYEKIIDEEKRRRS